MDTNPYAPPISAAPKAEIRRPVSSWLALAVVGFEWTSILVSLAPHLMNPAFRQVLSETFEEYPELWMSFGLLVLVLAALFVPLVALLSGWRSRWVYFVGGAGLFFACYENSVYLYNAWANFDLEEAEAPDAALQEGYFLLFVVVTSLLAAIVFRFFAGLRSRRYYRLARE